MGLKDLKVQITRSVRKMEFPLFLNQTLHLGLSKEIQYPDLQNGGAVVVERKTHSFEIPVRAKLLQDLNRSRIPTKLKLNQKLAAPQLTVALRKEDPRNEGFVVVVGLEKLMGKEFHGTGYRVQLRLDIDSIVSTRSNGLVLIPTETSCKYSSVL